MKILVVANSVRKGGLGRHIVTIKNELERQGVEYVYAFVEYDAGTNFSGAQIHTLSDPETVGGFVAAVEGLIDIIKSEHVDVVHIHPFNISVPAMIACQISQVPCVYTAHGYSSMTFTNRFVTEVLYRYGLYRCVARVFSVSDRYNSILESYCPERVEHVPNVLNAELYPRVVPTGDKWALVSRLDADKSEEIIELINNLDVLGISAIDIYGAGGAASAIEDAIAQQGLSERIKLRGAVDNVSSTLATGYAGVIGLGQVVLEGMFSGIPVLLIGWGRISGIVTPELYELIRQENFVNLRLPNADYIEIAQQIKQAVHSPSTFDFREKAISEFSALSVGRQYIQAYSTSVFMYDRFLQVFFRELKNMVASGSVEHNERLSDSYAIQDLVYRTFAPHYLESSIRPLFVDYFERRIMRQQIKLLEGRIIEQATISESAMNQKIADVTEMINLKTLTKKTVSLIGRRFGVRKR